MADQLCGQFYARLLSLPDIVPSDRALSSLTKVYDACFLKFQNGKFKIDIAFAGPQIWARTLPQHNTELISLTRHLG